MVRRRSASECCVRRIGLGRRAVRLRSSCPPDPPSAASCSRARLTAPHRAAAPPHPCPPQLDGVSGDNSALRTFAAKMADDLEVGPCLAMGAPGTWIGRAGASATPATAPSDSDTCMFFFLGRWRRPCSGCSTGSSRTCAAMPALARPAAAAATGLAGCLAMAHCSLIARQPPQPTCEQAPKRRRHLPHPPAPASRIGPPAPAPQLRYNTTLNVDRLVPVVDAVTTPNTKHTNYGLDNVVWPLPDRTDLRARTCRCWHGSFLSWNYQWEHQLPADAAINVLIKARRRARGVAARRRACLALTSRTARLPPAANRRRGAQSANPDAPANLPTHLADAAGPHVVRRHQPHRLWQPVPGWQHEVRLLLRRHARQPPLRDLRLSVLPG